MNLHKSTDEDGIEARLRRVEDILAIQRLKALYCRYNDGGWEEKGGTHRGPTADLFVEDGVWDGRPLLPLAEGRDAVRELMVNFRAVPYVVHNVMNPIIDINGDEAEGEWHAIGCATMPDGVSRWLLAYYLERYVRTEHGWKYKSMRVVTSRTWAEPSGWGEVVQPEIF